MSVPEPKRKPGKLRVETCCVEVCRTTRQLLCREDIFPKRSRWLGCKDIADAANRMLMNIFGANDIRVKTAEDARERRRLQTVALAAFGALEKRMTFEALYWEKEINQYSLWARQMNELGDYLKAWIYRDEKRYADLLGITPQQEEQTG